MPATDQLAQLQFHRGAPEVLQSQLRIVVAPRVLTRSPRRRQLRYGPVPVVYCISSRHPSCFEYSTYTSLQGQSQKEARLLAWRREGLGRDAGSVCSRGSFSSLALDDQHRCWDISPHPVRHKRPAASHLKHLAGGRDEENERWSHVSFSLSCCCPVMRWESSDSSPKCTRLVHHKPPMFGPWRL